MKPKRILVFSLVYYPRFIGGAEVAIKEITDRISPEEVVFDMITLRLDSSLPRFERVGNVNVHRVGYATRQKRSSDSLPWYLHLNKYLLVPLGFLKALSLLRKNGYDAIWSMMATYNSFAAILFKIFKPKVPFLLTLQEGDPPEHMERRAKPLWPLFKTIFTRADHIQCISNFLADWARRMGARCPVTVVPNAVDTALFSKRITEEEADSLKAKLNKRQGEIFLVTTSRLVEKNAVGDVIRALEFLPSYVKFLILGQGYEEESLKHLVKQMRLETRVIFLGYVPHKDMPPYLQISDIFIRPSLSEGLGNSFLEAMSAKIPVIATPVGGIPDFLVDGETGLFCEARNPRSIAQKVEKLMKDEESRDYIVKNACEMVERKYRWDVIVNDMKRVFNSVLN